MPGGSWRTGESFVHGTDSRQKRGKISNVGKNGRDAAGDEISQVQTAIGRGGDLGLSADTACSELRAGRDGLERTANRNTVGQTL